MRRGPGGDAVGGTNARANANSHPNNIDNARHNTTRDGDVRTAKLDTPIANRDRGACHSVRRATDSDS